MFQIIMTLLAITLLTSNASEILNVDIYSRAYNHEPINGETNSYININGVNAIVPADTCNCYRGLHIIVIDEINGNVIDAKAFDTWGQPSLDAPTAAYLQSIEEDKIVIITIHDSTYERGNIVNTVNVLNSFGCSQINSINYRESFIFVGTASTLKNPSWQYCEKSERYDGAIMKSFQIGLPVCFNDEECENKLGYICDLELNECVKDCDKFAQDVLVSIDKLVEEINNFID
eukprot:207967_1